MEKSQFLWKCRRGTKELDTILNRFMDKQFDVLTELERSELELLLAIEDPVLTDWLCNQINPGDQGMVNIVKKILSANQS